MNGSPLRKVPGSIQRRMYAVTKKWHSHDYGGGEWGEDRHATSDLSEATLLSSELLTDDLMHAPVLDIDFPAHLVFDFPTELVPSSTEGHYHLYLDKAISWKKYKKVLKVLGEAGILETGYVKASLARKHTAVRLPWVNK